jgi:hypothetical protein
MLSHFISLTNYVGVCEQPAFSWLLLLSNPLSLSLHFSLFYVNYKSNGSCLTSHLHHLIILAFSSSVY